MHVTKRREKPGSLSKGRFYHIEVRPKTQFTRFRVQDVGAPGGIERVSGQRRDGSWDTSKWLIEKDQAHVQGGWLVADTAEARKVIRSLGSTPARIQGDRFQAKPRVNVPERKKPTPRQLEAWRRNIRKAQAARWKS